MLNRSLQCCLASAVLAFASPFTWAVSPDHHEFEASVYAPFQGERSEQREFRLYFSYMDAIDPTTVAWRLEIRSADGLQARREWVGEERLFRDPIEIVVPWDGLSLAKQALPPGFYQVRLTATAGEPTIVQSLGNTLEKRVAESLRRDPQAIVQEWEIVVGAPPKIRMPEFTPLPVGAQSKSAPVIGGLPYTVYFGNLHTQSNDSDGGGNVATCSGSQGAQTGEFGPGDGFTYARNHGLDFSMASEHNHYFDGSSQTNSSAIPAVAIARYQSGLSAAATSNSTYPNFLALYGMEWGVISNGGHMNILGSSELFAWEYNGSNQLIGDVFTPKSDYPSIYATMLSKNLIGQFNHPSSSAQFLVNGTALGYSPDGDEVMVLAEIQNTSAFSNNTTETETSRSSYESAYKLMLERGFHVAPTTNQDNHCANWGASWTNRTGVLIPNGEALSTASFMTALRARRIFATSDKQSQLVFVANNHLMGERFDNSGPLTLTANFANTAGRTVSQAQIHEGVPGRNGTVTLLIAAATHTFTPSVGLHFYYAKLTQDDGKLLWSAPIWVNQLPVTDTTAPTVSGSVTGASGTIVLIANALDDVGVTSVTFAIDGIDRGSDTTPPYSIPFDSTLLQDGTHALVARATDAATNSSESLSVAFEITNSVAVDALFLDGFD